MKNNRFRGFSDRHQPIHIIEYSQPSERGGDLIQIILSAISPAPFHAAVYGLTWGSLKTALTCMYEMPELEEVIRQHVILIVGPYNTPERIAVHEQFAAFEEALSTYCQ